MSKRATATLIAPKWEGQYDKLQSLPNSLRTILAIGPKAEHLKNTVGPVCVDIQFCNAHDMDLSNNDNISGIANFLCEIADGSERLESVLRILPL